MRIRTPAAVIALAVAIGSCVEKTVAPPDSISAPSGVTVALVGNNSARVTWNPPPEAEFVDSYNVFRDGVKIGESITTSYLDNNLTQGVTYKYRVSANGRGIVGSLSDESAAATLTVPDVTPPTVTSTNPAAGATAVALGSKISATFSEPMDPATITSGTFFLKNAGGTVIPGTVTYDAQTRTAQLTPAAALPNTATVSATITTGVKDAAGNALASDFAFSFTTRDEVGPSVVSTSPVSGATGVPVTAPITVTFNKLIDVATLNGSGFAVATTSGGAAVTGTVSFDAPSRTGTFTPSAPLAGSTGYTATVAGTVKDLAGNTMGTAFSFSFTTADVTPPIVASVSPANNATDVLAGASIVVTFSEAMNAATINASTVMLKITSSGALVAGSVGYNAAAMTATFTPSAILAFATGYTVLVTTDAKDVAGNSLASAFSSAFATTGAPDTTPPTIISVSPAGGAGSVAVNSTVSVTFSEAMNAATVNGSTVMLQLTSSGALVAGSVSYNSATMTASFTPSANLAFATSYTVVVTTDAKDLAGNPLASAFSSAFATTGAPDTTPPTIISVSPINGAASVAVNATVSITFSEAMNPATISSANITLKNVATSALVSATVAYDAGTKTSTITPSLALAFGTAYSVTVGTGVTDLAGNSLAAPFASSFTTTTVPDNTPPIVLSTVPAHDASNVSVLTPITVTFSEAMNPATINTSTIGLKITTSGAIISGTVSYDATSKTAAFLPAAGTLAFATTYTLTASGAADAAGNSMTGAVSATFTTAVAPDLTPPTVTASSPANGATGVATTVAPTVTFSEPMNPATITGSTITLSVTATSAPVAGSVSYGTATNTASFTPSAPLSGLTGYTLTVTTGARDLASNALVSQFVASFTTADITAPVVLSSVPANGATNVSVSSALTVTFSEAMNSGTINGSTITLRVTATSASVSGSVSYNSGTNVATFTPSASLTGVTGYTLTVTTGAQDLAGNALASQFTASFTTADVTAPTVLSTLPANGAVGVLVTSAVTVTFSEAMKSSTISSSTITLRETATSAPVTGTVSYNSGTNAATFTPSAQLSFSTGYTLTVTTGVQDIAGNALASTFTAAFTTGGAPDVTPPTVLSFQRLGRTGAVLENRSITSVTFSEPMNPSSITDAFSLRSDLTGILVPGTLTYDTGTNTATFAASSPLTYGDQPSGTTYTLTVSTAAKDTAGNNLQTPFVSSHFRRFYFQGTNDSTDTSPALIHVHITFSQSGQTIGRAVECTGLSGGSDCDVFPRNAAGVDAVGALDDSGAAATITAVSGTFTDPGITFTFTLANGRSFTFTGTMTDINTLVGTMSGATLPNPVSITLFR